ncbi:MAG TPA: response regulator [Anaerolineae bacterium]|nr:response regulator [Anaerolineae bacterium]
MAKGRILVVEDDSDILNMLRIYFTSQGYEVVAAGRGGEALDRCRQQLPNVIVLDIMLPDIDGYEVCTRLRTNLRTSHIPIIFLTQKDERSDRIAGLELGADDYITKPFDIEELRLRVQGAMRRAERESLTNPTTGLPSGRLNEEQLRHLMRKQDWSLLYIGIDGLEDFNNAYGFLAGDDVLRFVALLLSETVDALGAADDYIGHVGGDKFMVISKPERAGALSDGLKARFTQGILSHYSFIDRDRGYIIIKDPDGKDRRAPLMRMCVGLILSEAQQFTDIREITEAAAEARRLDCATPGGGPA